MSQNITSLNSLFRNLKFQIAIFQRPKWFRYSYENVLGTRLELNFKAKPVYTETLIQRVLGEIDRLEKVYSRFDSASELNQWLSGKSWQVSPDLYWLLKTAEHWRSKTKGAFHPALDGLSTLWTQAEREGRLPDSAAIESLLKGLDQPFAAPESDSSVLKLFPYGLNFNAIAKGRIVDAACLSASSFADELLLNIGGDLRHRGNESVNVEIHNPLESVDNASPLCILSLKNQAVASSGSGKRAFRVAGVPYSHLIDPRTGWPVELRQGATVLAKDCATADVLATAFSVMKPEESLELADSLGNIGCLLVSASGNIQTNAYFDAYL